MQFNNCVFNIVFTGSSRSIYDFLTRYTTEYKIKPIHALQRLKWFIADVST